MNFLADYGTSSNSSSEDESTTEKEILRGAIKLQGVKLHEKNENKEDDSIHEVSSIIRNEIDKIESVVRQKTTSNSKSAREKPNIHDDDSDDLGIGPPIPTAFQQHSTTTTSPKTTTKSCSSDDNVDDDESIGPPIPVEFQQHSTTKNLTYTTRKSDSSDDDTDDDDLIGPPIPVEYQQHSKPVEMTDNAMEKSRMIHNEVENPLISDGSDGDDENDEKSFNFPVSQHIDFKHGSKAVTALAVDPTGTRFATGSVDYEVRFWDFVGMNSSLQSFRSLYPCGNHPIKALAYSSTGDTVLIISGMSQAKVLDRDGHEKLECIKGDQYISDMAKTKGHTSPLTDGCWHPKVREEFLTSSEDSTLRLWNVNTATQHKNIIKCRSKNGLKTTPTTCTYNRDATMIACACEDGSFQLWDTRKMFVNASKIIYNAHQNGTTTSRIAFSYSGTLVCTRGGDDTMKLWDLRMFRNPLQTATNLYSRYGGTDCMFNPQDNIIITGVSLERGETDGKLLFFNAATLEKVDELLVTNSHVIKAHWHPRLQQIFVGCGDGAVKVYYGDDSIKGAKLCAAKRPSRAKQMEAVAVQQIITPHALPLFRQDRQKSQRKKMEKERLDPVKSRRPDLPIKSGQGGRVANAGSTLSSYVIRNLGLSKRVEDDQDPRQAILKYAKEAAENPYWVSPAYAKTQPKAIFASETANNDEPVEKKKKIL